MYINEFDLGALSGIQMDMILVRFNEDVADGSQGSGSNQTVSRNAYPFKAGSLPGDMGMRFRHGKQCNLLFVDGHVEGHDITWMLVNQLNHLFYN